MTVFPDRYTIAKGIRLAHQSIGKTTDLVVPFGFYGYGNIGDEATLRGFARLLAHYARPVRVTVASRNPAHTRKVEPAFGYFSVSEFDALRVWAKLRAAAHVFAGGTPIMDVLGDWPLNEVSWLAKRTDRLDVPVSFIGVGTE